MTCSKDSASALTVASCLKSGGIAVVPTDTVYGFSGIVDRRGISSFGCDSRIRKIKGRAESKPLIQLIEKPQDAMLYTDVEIPPALMEKWPGALTVIVPVKDGCPFVCEGNTVALRCPGDLWLRQVIGISGSPIFSTSVNRSGSPVLEDFDSIVKEFGSEADLVVDDGEKRGALPSTLVKLEGDGSWSVLRQGSVIV